VGWFSRSVPRNEHVSCSKLIGELTERVAQLELDHAERNLQVLDSCEKIAERLQDRIRKREKKNEEPAPLLGFPNSRRHF